MEDQNNPEVLSQELLNSVKMDEDYVIYEGLLRKMDEGTLSGYLCKENRRLAFWLNIYNAFGQLLLQDASNHNKDSRKIYQQKVIIISGKNLSLDDIEHGILRRSQWKYGLGYIKKPIADDFEKKFRVEEVDPRIHFALNCGASSCPPIKFYQTATLENQLDLATQAYLGEEADYDKEEDILVLPKIMSWYRGDFGGKQGIIHFAKKYHIIPRSVEPHIMFKEYDWSLSLNKFSE